ncbi:methyltransferase [Sphingobacterium sp.]|uniref:tRNA1(Val) (adenine(37)-N6)-methyltransferase n=1 Tax=Sphingobacterium sp. TaxID=341027 RepID=UPI00258337B3|nr:methyltransferase [Sphingobacterium sp.]WET70263.1 MAG: methyltransferase [Sphingobacterium sp.]
MASIFRFKRFEVDQSDCAMKINTDGVLLASLLEVEPVDRVLDVGTGTGVIALMLAQRLVDSRVEAVEIDPLAAAMADRNFRNSIFQERLELHATSFQQMDVQGHYDLIVSNPPFYTDSLHNPDERKKLARHTDLDFFAELLDFAALRLSDRGKLVLIVPTALAETLTKISAERGLYCSSEVQISSFEGESAIRKIVTFERLRVELPAQRAFVIYAAKGIYSEAYRNALAPYFLAF